MRGRPRKLDNIDEIKKLSFKEFNDIIQTYIRLLKDSLEDEETPEKEKLYYNAVLSLPRYLLNILILKAEFKQTKKVVVILHMEDTPELVSSAITQAKNLIKEYLKQ